MTDAEKVVAELRERSDVLQRIGGIPPTGIANLDKRTLRAMNDAVLMAALAEFVEAANSLRAWGPAHGIDSGTIALWAADRGRYDAALARLAQTLEVRK